MRLSTKDAQSLMRQLERAGVAQSSGLKSGGRRAIELFTEVSRKDSPAEAIFAQQIRFLKLPVPKRNYRFVPGRKYEFDFAWPHPEYLIFEVQGGVHLIRARAASDTEKFFHATRLGWRVVPVTTDDVYAGRAVSWLTQLLEVKNG